MRNAPRVVALVAAPLLVVGATAGVMLARQEAGAPPVSPDGPKVTIQAPQQGAVLGLSQVVVLARAADPDGIATAELRVNDKRIANQLTGGGSTADLQFSWTPEDPGDYTLRVRARDNEGKWGEAVITVSAGTGLPPLPPPPTTAPHTTLDPGTSTSLTTLGPVTSVTEPPPTQPPPTQPPPTLPPPTLPPPTQPPTTESTTTTVATTVPPTDPTTTTINDTVPPTDPPTTVITTVSQSRCRLDPAEPLLPAPNSDFVPLQPAFVWTYAGSCPPVSQVLELAMPGARLQVALPGSARSYVATQPLPACTRVRWSVTAVDANGHARGAKAADFTTLGC